MGAEHTSNKPCFFFQICFVPLLLLMNLRRLEQPRPSVCRLPNMKSTKRDGKTNLSPETIHHHRPNLQTQVRQNLLNSSRHLDVECNKASNKPPSLSLRCPKTPVLLEKAVRRNPSERVADPCGNSSE